MRIVATIAISLCLTQFALAEGLCIDAKVQKEQFLALPGAKWIELTHDQWEFMRGIYALDPNTPKGLPFGDKAALMLPKDSKSGTVVFEDGDKICTPIPMKDELYDLLMSIGAGDITHIGVDN